VGIQEATVKVVLQMLRGGDCVKKLYLKVIRTLRSVRIARKTLGFIVEPTLRDVLLVK